ncbi:MAG: energy transducer TonB [Veillonellaceae bacterium]|nr:energy transducer TonB [Veillonellaceae bacterium]
MNYGDQLGWGKPLTGSVLFHVLLLVLVALYIHFAPAPEFVPREPVTVDIYSPGGGGGGGGGGDEAGVEEGDAAEEEYYDDDEYYEEDTVADMSQQETIAPTEQPKPAVKRPTNSQTGKKKRGSGRGPGSGPGSGGGSGGGTGGGHGTGHGTGTGSGSGPGTGTASGPQLLSAPSPSYPESARRAGQEGTVVVGLTIEVDGRVGDSWIISSSGSSTLDEAALSAVRRWKFVPAKEGGRAIRVNSQVPVTFNLRDA